MTKYSPHGTKTLFPLPEPGDETGQKAKSAAAAEISPAKPGAGSIPSTFAALVIDNSPDPEFQQALRDKGWSVEGYKTIGEVRDKLPPASWTFVVCPTQTEGGSAKDILQAMQGRIKRNVAMVIVTQEELRGTAAEMIEFISAGAEDYLVKPIDPKTITNFAEIAWRRAEKEIQSSEDTIRTASDHNLAGKNQHALIARSPAMLAVAKQVAKYATTDLPCFITGETGTGKEVIARQIHQQSKRSNRPFIAINCGAFNEELLESELFGHVKGSFTGALADKTGLWEEANNGTIFLDEVGETSTAFQVKLLRVLAENEIRPVGARKTKSVSVRVVAATNRNVHAEIKAGRFREDLYHRLNAVQLFLPSLRDRKDDIDLLIDYFMEMSGTTAALSPQAREALNKYAWPGNVRELRKIIDRIVATAKSIIHLDELPTQIIEKTADELAQASPILRAIAMPDEWPTLQELIDWYIIKTYEVCGKNKTRAAAKLNIHIRTFRHNFNVAVARQTARRTGQVSPEGEGRPDDEPR